MDFKNKKKNEKCNKVDDNNTVLGGGVHHIIQRERERETAVVEWIENLVMQ